MKLIRKILKTRFTKNGHVILLEKDPVVGQTFECGGLIGEFRKPKEEIVVV